MGINASDLINILDRFIIIIDSTIQAAIAIQRDVVYRLR